ncbi:hypothetical protein [Brachybacterium sp. YJGR34]|uniref:hypothetical protein n=1 Tax=Brachybacterium sp. YJGR34 TaxID=2059911 RepID=UPI000E0A4A02|nr:hypothetical protein [Brachybacterium sp. YJGR34]
MSSARDLLAALLLTVAAVLGALWLPGVWLAQNVVDRDGFLAIAQPLAEDPEAQREVSDAAVEHLLDDDRIPGWAEERLTPVLQEQAPRITGTPAYATLWEQTMVELHDGLFTPGEQTLAVDLTPVIDDLLGAVEEQVPLVELPRPEEASVPVATVPDVALLNRLVQLAPWTHWAGPIAGVLVLLALLVAAHRRALLTLAGVAGIVAGGLLCLLAGNITTLVPASVDEADFLRPIVGAFEAQFTADLMPQGVIVLGVGALCAAAGMVMVGLHRRS